MIKKPDLLLEATLRDHNAHLEVQGRGTYSLVEVYDALCPGTVTMTARDFNIEWIARPTVDFCNKFVGQARKRHFHQKRYL